EGLRIPALKFYEEGRPNETLMRIISKNVRVPRAVLGDLASQVAACSIAEREFLKLAERYGFHTLETYFAELLDYTERMTRAEIGGWPDGEFRFEDVIDDDGIDDRPIPIVVTVTVRGDELIADYTGSSEQVKGAINASPSFAKSAVYLTVRSVMDAAVPSNAGFFRPIAVITPPGTIVNPALPAAFAARGLTGFRMIDAMLGALARSGPAASRPPARAATPGSASGAGTSSAARSSSSSLSAEPAGAAPAWTASTGPRTPASACRTSPVKLSRSSRPS
nr:hydantoinase B/oxoprolinase family protein [Actinomycetota bacterium]